METTRMLFYEKISCCPLLIFLSKLLGEVAHEFQNTKDNNKAVKALATCYHLLSPISL